MTLRNFSKRVLRPIRWRLEKTEVWNQGETSETAIHLLSGTVRIMVTQSGPGSKQKSTFCVRKLGSRSNVFSGLPSTLVVKGESYLEVTPETETADLLIFEGHNPFGFEPGTHVVRPEDVLVKEIGEGPLSREVRVCLGEDKQTELLHLGETINPPGGWSSYPHHDFVNQLIPEEFSEYFFFILEKGNGYGIVNRSGMFTDGDSIDGLNLVTSGMILPMPLGDHPVVACPWSKLFYAWCYVSPKPKQYSRWADEIGGYAVGGDYWGERRDRIRDRSRLHGGGVESPSPDKR